MKELVDKAALVAEIERRIILLENNSDGIISMLTSGMFVNEYKDLLSFLDTLEVEKVVAEQKGTCIGMLNTIIGDATWHVKIPLDKAGLKNGDKVKMFITKEK